LSGPPPESAGRQQHFPLFYKLSLANKILVSTGTLLLLLGLSGTVIFQFVLRDQLVGEFANNAAATASVVANQASHCPAVADTVCLETLLSDLKSADETVGYAVIVHRDGEVLAHTFSWDPPDAVLGYGGEPSSASGAAAPRKVTIEGERYLEVAAPIRAKTQGVGVLYIGVTTARISSFVGRLNLMFLGVLAVLTLLGMVAAQRYFRFMTRPIEVFTRLADEVSVGNLDVDFDFGRPVRCWEIKNCDQTGCVVHQDTSLQCWYVDGTPCEGYESRFPQKLVGCRTCEVYQAHKGDEIVQLADSFHHMTHVLRDSREELERSDHFQHMLIQNSLGGVIATDEGGVVRICNRVARRLTGYEEGEVVGKLHWTQLFVDEVSEAADRESVLDGSRPFGFYRLETAIIARDGKPVPILASAIALLEGEAEIGKVFFFQDLRDIQTLREELVSSARLAATGQTVASISHSIKNILEGLRGGAYVYNRGKRLDDADIRAEGWEMVERNIQVISSLVADLLNYAKDRVPELDLHDPGQLVEDVEMTLRVKAEQGGVDVVTELDRAADPTEFDYHAMHQCLANLVSNAIDATADIPDARVVISTRALADDELEIRVSDNGPGIAPEVVDKLFVAMVSTKASQGTGLGLLVVHKVVAEHKGTVDVLPTLERGTTFSIKLPRGNRKNG